MDYIYDLVGKIQQVNDPTGTYTFAYDNMGRLLGTSTQYAFLPGNTYANIYTYDKNSNRTSFSDPQGSTTNYTYDTLNRLQTLQSPQGSFGFTYDPLNRRTQMTRPNGVNTNYTYDSLSRLLTILHQTGATTIDGATYTYDNAGNRLTKLNHLNGITESYSYDNIYQLLSVLQGSTTTESYTYDKVGNRLSDVSGASYTVNNSNQLTTVSGSPNTTFTYDNNGNTLTKVDASGTTTYTWNSQNQLTQVSLPGGATVTFKYDPFGRRVQKVSAAETLSYLYDQSNLLEELDHAGIPLAKYSQDEGIDEPLAMLRGGVTNLFEQDGLGSITSLTNGTGTVSDAYTYDSFGKLAASSGNTIDPFRYTGREFDSETGLYYYRARYFDPSTGRFLSEDPIKFAGGINFFAYTLNNPINNVDPDGLKARLCCRPVHDFFAKLAGERHCFIVIEDNPDINNGKRVVYSLIPNKGYGNTTIDYDSDVKSLDNGTAECYDVNGNKCSEKAIEKNHSDPGPSGGNNYKRFGPNSNTYCRYQLVAAQCSVPKVDNAMGFDDPLAVPRLTPFKE